LPSSSADAVRARLYRLSLYFLLISLGCFALSYGFFHFLTDAGITLVWQPEAGKPFVTLLIGILATLFLFASAVSALSARVLLAEESTKTKTKNDQNKEN